jgi:transcriptional regulator with XRE-family HTH domain
MLADRSFDVWLRDAMAKQNLSAPTLAKRLDLPRDTVADWVYGIERPAGAVIPALAEAFGVTITELRRALDGQ